MDSIGYLLTAVLLTLLNVHWWVWSAVVHYVCRKTIKTKDANKGLSTLIGSVVAGLGIGFFEASVTPDRLTFLELCIGGVVVILTLQGVIRIDKKSVVKKARLSEAHKDSTKPKTQPPSRLEHQTPNNLSEEKTPNKGVQSKANTPNASRGSEKSKVASKPSQRRSKNKTKLIDILEPEGMNPNLFRYYFELADGNRIAMGATGKHVYSITLSGGVYVGTGKNFASVIFGQTICETQSLVETARLSKALEERTKDTPFPDNPSTEFGNWPIIGKAILTCETLDELTLLLNDIYDSIKD